MLDQPYNLPCPSFVPSAPSASQRGNSNHPQTPRLGGRRGRRGIMGQKGGRFNSPISQSWPSFDGGQKGHKGQVFEKNVLQKAQPPSPITPTNITIPHL